MHNPLVIEAIMLFAAILVGVWSQRALPLHADSRPILFLLCLFVGTGSALCLLLDGLALLFTGQAGRVVCEYTARCCCWWRCGNPSTGLSASWRVFCSGEPQKGRAKTSATADDADPLPPETRITFSLLPSAPGGRSDDIARTGAGQ